MSRTLQRIAAWSALSALVTIGLLLAAVVRLARSSVTPPKHREYPMRILGVDRQRSQLVLSDNAESRVAGNIGIWFGHDAGYLRAGKILSIDHGRVVRELIEVVSGTPRVGQRARESGWFYLGPWEIEGRYQNVTVSGEVGELPAWLIEPTQQDTEHADDWVIHVHGRTSTRAETLRGAAMATQAGWRSLVISYRNDKSAPGSVDGRYGLGSTEARDVLAAIRYAGMQGAKHVVLFGWSMGGAACVQAARIAQLEPELPPIVGLILESPALSWPEIFRHHARLMHAPQIGGDLVSGVLTSSLAPLLTGVAHPLDWGELDGVSTAIELQLPILLLHSRDDDYVPFESSARLAALEPGLVRYLEFSGAGHVRLWNQDPERWEREVRGWLAERAEPNG